MKKDYMKISFLLCCVLLSVAAVLSGCGAASGNAGQKVIRIGYQKGDEFNIARINGSLDQALEKKRV
jgi:hypothetical protein